MNRLKVCILSVFLPILIFFSSLSAQNVFDFGFRLDPTVPVYDSSNQLLKNAWAGGMNSVHFNEMDLNFDGIKDLVVFDTHSDKLSTFINQGTAGTVDYVYAPEYEMAFPKLYSWLKLRDFNGDGKEDIFTYGFAGIKVYKNTSSVATGLSFSLYTPMLNAMQGGSISNILVTSVDYPAIEDIDGDGDLEVLVFYGMGALIDFYDNLSVENLGTNDTLWMKLSHRCWGWFSESTENNSLTLNIDLIDTTIANYCQHNLKGQSPVQTDKAPKHTGTTMLLLDLTGNNLKDLIIGDTDFPTVAALFNTGSPDSARMTSMDSLYPSYDTSIHIYSLASIDYLDVNNDGRKDLIAGAFDPSWEVTKTDNIASVWYYKNTSSTGIPEFHLQTKNFLQDQMIDVGANSYPVLFDYDGDSLLDLFIGNFGVRDSSWWDAFLTLYSKYSSSITLYKNTGTATQPQFTFVTDDFAGIRAMKLVGAYPTFGDLNGDGKPDMLLGDTTGRMHYFENVAPAGQPMQLSYVSSNYQNIDVGNYCTPQLFDLDNDGLLDLVTGYRYWNHTNDGVNYIWRTSLAYFKNTGNATNPQFTHQTDTLGGINVNDSYFHYYYGYSSPCFFKDSAGVVSLFVGSGTGLLFYYRNITNNLAGVFEKDSNMTHVTDYDHFYSVQHFENKDHNAQTIDVYLKSTVTVGDLNNDGYPDMIVGNHSGGLTYFIGSQPLGIGIAQPGKAFTGDVNVFPNPAGNQVFVSIKEADRSIRTLCTVFSISGQQLMQVSNLGDDLIPLDTWQLPNGIYLLKIDVQSPQQGSTGTFTRKLVVKR